MIQLSLSEIRVVNPWSKVKLGTLLQVSTIDQSQPQSQPQPAIGVRCQLSATDNRFEADGVVIVSGSNVGKFVFEKDLQKPALDISEWFEIVADDLCPNFHPINVQEGALYQRDDACFIWFRGFFATPVVQGFICLLDGADPNKPGKVGHYEGGLGDSGVLIARTAVVRRKQISRGI